MVLLISLQDPSNCGLNALMLCEGDPASFECAYRVVVSAAAAAAMSSSQLFTVARFMEHRGHSARAFKLALLAVTVVRIAHNQVTKNSAVIILIVLM